MHLKHFPRALPNADIGWLYKCHTSKLRSRAVVSRLSMNPSKKAVVFHSNIAQYA